MNTFKRELTIYIRSKLFLILTPCFILIPGIWNFIILKSFENNTLDIKAFYNLFPIILAITIPLITQGLWLREKQRGLEGILLQSSFDPLIIVIDKVKAVLVIFSSHILSVLTIIIVLSFLGFIDIGQLILVNTGLILFSLLAISIGVLFSVLLKNRILCYFVTMLTLLFLTSVRSFSVLGLLSIERYLDSFNSGILNIKSLFFFVSLSATLILLAVMIIKKRIILRLIMISLISLSALLIPGRFDLTQLRSYTLAESTNNIFRSIDRPISLTYYYSKDLENMSGNVPAIKSYLKLFKKLDKCSVNIISDEYQDFKRSVGLNNPYPLEDELYSFIIIEYNDAKRVIPLIAYVEELEFTILKNVDDMINGKKHVAIMPGNEGYTEDNFSMLYKKLSESFNVSFVFPGDRIPKDVESLIIAGHYSISYDVLAMIGDYLGTGGNILVAGTGLPTDEGLTYRETPVLNALKYCGVEIEPYLIGDNRNVGLIDEDGRVTPYPLNVITSGSKGGYNPSVFPFSGFDALYLSPVLSREDNFVPLLKSSGESWLVNQYTGIEGTPEGSYTAAVFGVGEFAHNFSGADNGYENKMIVLGNSLSLTDMSYSLGIDNGYNFILRAIYLLNGDDEFLYSQDKLLWDKRFYKVDDDLKKSLFNLFKVLFIIIYPIVAFAFSLKIKKS